MDMEENFEVAPLNSQGSPDADALYCEECLRVDRSFNDIPNTAPIQDRQKLLVLSLKADTTDIKPDTTCPSCRDILNILDEMGPMGTKMCNITLRIEGDHFLEPHRGEISSACVEISWKFHRVQYHDSYLLPRSDYPMRLRPDLATYNEAKNLPIVLIKSWLHTCEGEHEVCRSDPANELDMSLYLIDVVEECITLKPVSNVRYIALSYVWGNVKSTNLTSGNMEELRKPRSLSSGSHVVTVPQTIRDAMRLTVDLDIRYLWVDCLCLIQNDPNISFYLNRMHLIYANAFLTILVANKDNANGGITGYDTRSTGRILPGQVINYPNYVLGKGGETLGALPWSSRAWTLQEGLSSRRVLVIDDRICLKCVEDISEEGSDFGFKLSDNLSDRMGGFVPTLCEASLTEWKPNWGAFSQVIKNFAAENFAPRAVSYDQDALKAVLIRKPDWDVYSLAAKSFASRALSYDQDSIKAFLGVINFFTSLDDTRLLYGHPICKLSHALLWSSGTAILERRMLLRQDASFVMPSWSWMAWRHNCQTIRSRPLGHWWPSGKDKAKELQVPIVIDAQCDICLQNHQMTSEKCSKKASPERVKPEYLDPYLYIQAQRARFGVLSEEEEDEEEDKLVQIGTPLSTGDTTNEALRSLIPLGTTNDAEETIVGHMTFDRWPPQFLWDEAGTLDFIGISYVEAGWLSDSGQPEVQALCVIPVNGKPGVFERRGVATILKDVWDQAAQFDEIILG